VNNLLKIGKDKKSSVYNTTEKARSVPDGIVVKCPECKYISYRKELFKHLNVCKNCDYHFPLDAKSRIASLLDQNSFIEMDKNMISDNPLNFPQYSKKIKADQKKTNLLEAVITGQGLIGSLPVVIAVMDARFRMGSMGSVVGEKICRAMEHSLRTKTPFIIFTASGGARMQEGVISLMQMAKTSAAAKLLDEAGILNITVLTSPTTGGVSASFANLGDFNFAEPGALIGFAGKRIIEQTIREELPEDFQTAEFLLEKGQLDKILPRKTIRDSLLSLLVIHNRKDVTVS
jgi:acetyl-CoA carboxylase carboxyl transferase subunit beta